MQNDLGDIRSRTFSKQITEPAANPNSAIERSRANSEEESNRGMQRRRLYRSGLLALLLVGTVSSALMVGFYGRKISAVANYGVASSIAAIKHDASILKVVTSLESFSRTVDDYDAVSAPDTASIAAKYQLFRRQFNAFVAARSEIPNNAKTPDIAPSKLSLDSYVKKIDSAMAALADDPAAISGLETSIEAIRPAIEEMTSEDAQRYLALITGIQERISEEDRKVWIFACIAMLVWIMSGVLVLNYLRQARERAHGLLLEKQKMDIASKEALDAKNTFLGMISHELRTPLQAITASIDLLTERYTTEKDKKCLDRLNIAVQMLAQQLRDLTDYARMDSGKLELREEEFNPTVFLNYIVDEYRPQAERKRLALKTRIDSRDRDLLVVTDPYRFQQIANNLLSNAIKYTETGSVTVWLHMQTTNPPSLILKVHDTGPGIDEAQAERIFEPFTQIDQSSTRRFDGTGMGLAIVKRLVGLLNGHLSLKSTVGEGSRFEVSIPVEVRRLESRSDSAMRSGNSDVKRVLVVDDNMAMSGSMQALVEHCGFECDVADGGRDALIKVHSTPYTAILLDINMPDIDGFEVAATIRKKIGPNQRVPIVAVTGNIQATQEQKKPFSEFIQKPIELRDVRRVLKHYTEQSPRVPESNS